MRSHDRPQLTVASPLTNPGADDAFRDGAASNYVTGLRPEVPVAIYLESFQVGGAAAYATDLAIWLRRRGHAVHLLCPQTNRSGSGPLTPGTYIDRLVAANVPLHEMRASSSSAVLSRVGRVLELRHVFAELGRPVVILVMGYIDGGGPVAVAARLANARAVIRAELQPPMPPLTKREVRAARTRDLLTDRVVVGSLENRHLLAELMGREGPRFAVVNSGIDLAAYRPGEGRAQVRELFACTNQDVLIGTISRLVARKGVSDFIAAADLVQKQRPNPRFLIVGDGPDRAALEAQALTAGLRNLEFAGYRADIPRLLAAMDVFVMPSHFEGGPLILLEAMAMELPVVATNVGMAPEVIESGRSGLLIERGNPAAMATAICSLLGDAARRRSMGRAARERIKHGLTLDQMVDGYLRVCAESIGR